MLSIAPKANIVDISHSVKKYAIRDGAYLLTLAVPWFPVGIHVAVVDPGVGTARRPIGLKTMRGDVLIGPDNGLLLPVADSLGGIDDARILENRDWMLEKTSSTFHGRDIFSPMAGHLAVGGEFEKVGPRIDPASLVALDVPGATARDGGLDSSVLYVDSFGNLRIAGVPADLASAMGELQAGRRLVVEFGPTGDRGPQVEHVPWARTFGETEPGTPLLYEDSFGHLAYADNQGNVAARLGIAAGTAVRIRPA
jgi:S-adenosylmethionine hydrolase